MREYQASLQNAASSLQEDVSTVYRCLRRTRVLFSHQMLSALVINTLLESE